VLRKNETELTKSFVPCDFFAAAGIDTFQGGLVIVTTATGLLFYHDLDTGTTIAISSPNESFAGGDGLLVHEDKAYVSNNESNQIIVYDLVADTEGPVTVVTATLAGTIESPDFDSPSSSALVDTTLYSVNSRFSSLPFPSTAELDLATFEEEFQIVLTSIDEITV
jgi:hypothetical protein